MNYKFYLIVSIFLAIAAFVLAYKEIDGWGYFLFGSICTFVYPSKTTTKTSTKDDDEDDEDDEDS